jgi:hypothetical protein
MIQLLLFLGFSLVLMFVLFLTEWNKKIEFKSLVGLFLFGMLMSIPFVLIEYLGFTLKYYLVILTFIAIELGVIYCEHKVKYLHDLIHHNIKDFRIISFFIIGIGFTYSEIAFHIFNSQGPVMEIVKNIPIKMVYALLMHTVLTSAASLANLGNIVAKSFYETVFKFVSYYLRITIIGISHFLYAFSMLHHLIYLMIFVLICGICSFFYFKKRMDSRKYCLD